MTTSTTVNDNNTSATENATITTANATANLNNSSGTDTVTTDGTGTTTVNANNSTGTDDVYIANASSATVNLNNSTGNDDVDISGAIVNATVNDNNSGVAGVSGNDCIDITGATVTAAVNLNNSVGNDDVTIAGTTSVNATVNDNNSGVVGGTDIIDITGAAIIATVNLNNSVGNDDVIIGGAGTTSVKATVNLNNSGGTDVVNVTGASATVTVNLTNSAGGDLVDLVGAGTGTINATNSLGNNTLVGDNTTDTITGGTGNDIVDLMGAGTIDAGKGNDLGIYDLLDHYGKGGGADYYYGQGGTDTLEIVWNASLYNPAVNTAIQTQINGYYTFLAGHPDVNQTYTFNFGGNTAPLTVAGWQTLKISGLMPVIAVPGAQNLTPGQTTLITGVSLSETGNVAGETFTVTLSDTSGDLSANKSAPGGGGTITGSGTTGLTITGTLAQVNADLTTLKDTVATPDTIRLSATDSYGNSAIEQAIAVGSCGDITATGKNVSATEGISTGTVTVATFTDANPLATTADFTATITWGDGTTSSGTVSESSGVFTVGGSHTYAEDGSYTPTVTINDDGGSTATDGGTTTVADAALTAGAATVSGGVEGVTAATLSATFTDANTGAPASDFSGTIDWGDGTAAQSFTSSAVSGSGGSYTVGGSHTYAEEGSYTPTVTINDDGGSTATDSGTTTVADAALTAGAATVSGGVEGVTAATLSATFTDANTGAPASDFSGTINWGDGTAAQSFTSSAVSGSGGSYTVGGSHTYAEEGSYTPTVTINDDGGSTATDSGTTTVADAALTAGAATVSGGVEGVTAATLSATFTDANTGAPASDFSGTINWGDGTAAQSFTSSAVSGSGGSYTVGGSHTYAEDGSYTPTVTINDDGGSTATDSGTTTVADAALTAGAATVSGGVEGVTAATLSATFTDANTGAPASDFSGTIDWGDGTAAQSFTSSAVSGSGGSYTVGGSHTYAEDGSYTPTVTINDDGGSTATDSGTTTVADAALTAGAATVSGGVEGVTAATLSATFTDANTGAPASDFSGTIDWGDGTAAQSFTSSAVSGSGGSYTVGGSHTYAEEGSYTPTVTINDDGGSTATDGGTTTVADAALTATGKNISATEGSSTGTVTVATFTDANPNAPTTDFTATINWGDGGATSTGTVTESSGVFSVSGSHTYAAQGTDTISVSISDDGGSMASPSSTATVAEVLDASNTVPGAQSATEGVNKAITGISISDLDATGNVTTTLSVLHGTLTVLTNVTNGLTAGEVTNNGTGTVTLTGTVTQINTTLEATNGLVYLEQGDHTSDTLTVATQDQGTSPLLTATSNVTINVTEALDATNTVPGAQSATEGVNKAITGVSVSDADATGNVTTTLSVMHGTLTVLTNVSGGLTAIGVSGNGTGTVVLTGSVTQIDNTLAATNGLVYLTTGSQNDTLSVATQDQGTSPLLTATNTVAINVTASGPTVTSVSYTTSTGNTEIDHKDSATITLTFSEAVTVTGAPLLTLNVIEGGTPDTATFTSGSGTNKLVFTYTVPNSGAGDQTTALAITAINLKGGTIQDAAHINANTTGADVTLSPHLGVNEPAAPAGVAGDPINLALTDPSAGQAAGPITLMFTGVPSDWSLNQGTNLGNGSWTVQTSDPTALTVTTPASFAGAALLGVAASWTNADGGAGTASLQTNVEAYAPGSPIFAVSGDDTLTGGGGNDEFVFAQPIGNDTVYNFNVASDQIDLIGFNNFTTFVDIQANMADDANGNAVITAATGESVTIVGVDAALLTASDFVLNQEPLTNSAGTMTVGDAAMLPLGGTIDNTGTIALGSTGDETDLEILVKGATLQGGGQVTLSDNGQNVIFGGAADAVLTNVDNTISGAGRLGDGQMTLVNDGTIDATGTNALVLDTGTNIITNSGTLEATGTGGLIVNSAVDNSGSLSANGGNLTLNGAVTGNGTATISGAATLEFGAASAEATSFAAGATGTLKLDQSSGFTGVVSGFGAGDALDLADIAFGANTTIGYSVNADGAGGTLSVSDGTHSAGIALFGQYAASGFQVGSDNGTGAIVTYTPPTASLDAALITNPNQKT